jgi:hypothetical protein
MVGKTPGPLDPETIMALKEVLDDAWARLRPETASQHAENDSGRAHFLDLQHRANVTANACLTPR